MKLSTHGLSRWSIATLMTVACVAAYISSGAAAKPLPKPAPQAAPQLKAVGNEPFWSLTVKSQGIEFQRAGEAIVRFPYSKPTSAIGRPADLVQVYQLKNSAHQGVVVVNRMVDSSCNDTMSDNRYPFSVTIVIDGQVLSGCASSPKYPVIQSP